MFVLACRLIIVVSWVKLAVTTDPPCIIDLQCEECIPDNMPLVTSHRAANGSLVAASGDELALSCGARGKFAAYPLHGALAAACEAGRLRVRHDRALRHLLELGCQESVFEDVLHQVEHCAPPSQGRAYQVQDGARGVRRLATVCFDADRGVALHARASNARPAPVPAAAAAPLSLLGNFNHLFDARTRLDAERLYADAARLNRRLRALFEPDGVAFAHQELAAAELLSGLYFEDQSARVAALASNKVGVWRSVAEGNLRALQRDVAALLRAARPRALRVVAGTHGVAWLRAGGGRRAVWLGAGRFPAPRYVWTAVLDAARRRGLALVVLNDPFVAVSEIREAVFCESACARVPWLRELRRNRNYETPLYGLVFCCSLGDFSSVVTEMPRDIVEGVTRGAEGMLIESDF
ncbi:uncharacterized protein LOC135077380 isoform X2 [Ostrinia nubilalis]|uniref:uncharacterized protein LOC135077380 isoform X2 n=1 Tax=Ostrinia nubilalis TaxID=29057 RepID=UPI00308246FB